MVSIKSAVASTLAALVGLGLVSCGPPRPAPMSAFEGRLLDWTTDILRDDPELAALAGVSDAQAGGPYADRLTDRAPLAAEARRTAAIRRYAELMSLDAESLSAGDRLTYDVISARFAMISNGARFGYGELRPLEGIRPYVLNQLDSAFITLPSFFAERHPIVSSADAENYIARLDAVADALDGETARARADAAAGIRPPRFIMDATLAQLERVLSLPPLAQPYIIDLRAKLDARATSISDPAQRATIERENLALVARAEAIVRGEIIPAHQRAAQFLIAERPNASDDAGVSRLPQGRDYYAAALAIETTTPLTPDEIHSIGLTRIAALNRELDIALRRVGLTAGSVGERLAQVTADPRHRYEESDEGRAQLLRDIEARVARMMERAPQYFGRMPRSPLVVRRVPLLAEASQPGAYYSPPTLDGAQPGVYYINLRNLAEMTRIDVPTQDFHEAAPGHHFQVALAQEIEDAPLLRRLTPFNAYAEGWGLYAEQLADEIGFYERDPIGRIGYLRWQLWRAARLVVDTGLHAKGWSRQQAIDYMVSVTGDALGTISTEVDRYVVWPGQACGYELGRSEIVRLREEARNELGPDFDVRGFHDAVLLNGELPLSILDQVVRDWIPEQRRLADRERRRR